MSMISEQVKDLREAANIRFVGYGSELLNKAADTIEALSANVAAENMERSERYYGGGWFKIDKNNIPQGEVLGCNSKGGMAVGKIKKVREGDIRVVDFMGGGLMNCIAYMPLPEPYRPITAKELKL